MSRNSSLTQQSLILGKRLDAIPREVVEAIRPALIKGANEVADNMRLLAEASRDTGDLINSIAVTGPNETTPPYAEGGATVTANANQALITVGDENVRTAHMVEFGTSKAGAKPFILPAWRIAKPRVVARITRAISKAIKAAGRANA